MIKVEWALATDINAQIKILIFSKLKEDNGLVTYYGIEAPRNCPMREAFEWGEIEWEDFWTHKDVLYEITMPFNPGLTVGRPIKPSELPQDRA